MTRKSLVFIFTVSLLCMGQIIPPEKKSKYSIEYPYEVVLECDSNGNSYGEVIISTNSTEDILIDRIKLSNKSYLYTDSAIHLSTNYTYQKNLIKEETFNRKRDCISYSTYHYDKEKIFMPHILQLFTQELYRHWKRTGQSKITTDDVDTVFDRALMGEAARDKLQHFYSRIKAYYHPSEYSIVHTILLELARSPEGISKSGLFTLYQQTHQQFNTATTAQHYLKNHFERLLWRLESDFYIQQKSANSQYDFSSRLLKTWWQRTYSYGK